MDSSIIFYLEAIGLLLLVILVFFIYRAVKLIINRGRNVNEDENGVIYFNEREIQE